MTIREFLIGFISKFSLYDITLFMIFCLLGICFIFIAFVVIRHKIISGFIFILGVGIFVAMPFLMRFFMQEKFYNVEINYAKDQSLKYIDVYYLDATIKNVGNRTIKGCFIKHQILYDTHTKNKVQNYRHLILNYIKPLHVFSENVKFDLPRGQSTDVHLYLNDYKFKAYKYKNHIECYGK